MDSVRYQDSQTSFEQALSIDRCDRWQIHQRLQDLEIPCTCSADGKLLVMVQNPIAALQVWSVVHQYTASRQTLQQRLERCWRRTR